MAPRRFGKVEKLPSGNHRASYVHRGERHFAPVVFARAADAETWLATQRADIARGTWAPANPAAGITLAEYALTWLRSRDDLKPRTIDLYAGLLDRHILPTLGEQELAGMTVAHVRDWHTKLGTTTGATARAQSYRLLRTITNQAVRDGVIAANPCQLRGAGTPATPERPAPTIPQIWAIADDVPPRYRAMVLVSAFGGLRRGEVTALTRADIDLAGDYPTLTVNKAVYRIAGQWRVGTPKTAAGTRRVALPAFMHAILTEHLATYVPTDESALVFGTASGKPLAGSNWSATLRRTTERLGLPAFHFHDTRHAAATLASQNGATVKDTMQRLGHASARAALIYQHSAAERDVAIAASLDQAAADARANVVQLKPRRSA